MRTPDATVSGPWKQEHALTILLAAQCFGVCEERGLALGMLSVFPPGYFKVQF